MEIRSQKGKKMQKKQQKNRGGERNKEVKQGWKENGRKENDK